MIRFLRYVFVEIQRQWNAPDGSRAERRKRKHYQGRKNTKNQYHGNAPVEPLVKADRWIRSRKKAENP